MSEIKFEVVKKIGVLSTSASGWSKEPNLIRWSDRDAKYDIRDWSADRDKLETMNARKGIRHIGGTIVLPPNETLDK